MIIKLDSYELMEALSEHLKTKNCNLDFDRSYVEIHALINEPIRQQKKHKNGRVIKDENGYAEWEIIGHEKKSVHINTNSDIEIFIEN
mgnify:CR=1 FL=1